jgi:hypothetical protein
VPRGPYSVVTVIGRVETETYHPVDMFRPNCGLVVFAIDDRRLRLAEDAVLGFTVFLFTRMPVEMIGRDVEQHGA